MGTLQGFETYRDFRVPEPREPLLASRLATSVRVATRGRPPESKDAGGEAIATAAAEWVRNHGPSPFFLFLNLNEAHLPFLPQRPDFLRFAGRIPRDEAMASNLDSMLYIAGATRLTPEDLALLAGLYVGEIAYVDRQIGRVLAALDEAGRADDTIVIITSDHGENIGEHRLMGHVLCVYDTLLRVPLVIRYPRLFAAGALDERPAQLIDILPTLVEIADPEALQLLPRLPGRSLLAPEPRAFALAEYQRPDSYLDRYPERFPEFDTARYRRDLLALSAGSFKLIEGSDGRRELYDLARDPGETADLAQQEAARAGELSGLQACFREGLARREAAGDAPALDEEMHEELRSLGYIR
jgi:arylsulfatase A-like enzyme